MGSLVIALSRVDTLKPIVLDLASEEGGYPKDVFTAGALPGGRESELALDWYPGVCVVARRCDYTSNKIVGVIPDGAVASMRALDAKGLQSHLDSL